MTSFQIHGHSWALQQIIFLQMFNTTYKIKTFWKEKAQKARTGNAHEHSQWQHRKLIYHKLLQSLYKASDLFSAASALLVVPWHTHVISWQVKFESVHLHATEGWIEHKIHIWQKLSFWREMQQQQQQCPPGTYRKWLPFLLWKYQPEELVLQLQRKCHPF